MEAPPDDVFNAFLQGDLVEYVYMIPPPGLVLVLVYVDDLLITGSNPTMIEASKLILQQHFKIKDLGEMKYFFGLEIARSKQGILVRQRNFSLDLISDLGLAESKPTGTSLEVNQRLTSVEFDERGTCICIELLKIANSGLRWVILEIAVLQNMEIVETNGINFAAFQLSGSAKKWWRDYMLTRPVGSPALTWTSSVSYFLRSSFRALKERATAGSSSAFSRAI
uniref:Uncharacterized protein LOC104245098 n=1 Tax=Nicotiana sylvestris TaxID=4096 RepID=A0A1U7Y777_NICSY|nr:PREDICTED: uncharacterized protein LOC104245098 [Nicotiana sylvestris]